MIGGEPCTNIGCLNPPESTSRRGPAGRQSRAPEPHAGPAAGPAGRRSAPTARRSAAGPAGRGRARRNRRRNRAPGEALGKGLERGHQHLGHSSITRGSPAANAEDHAWAPASDSSPERSTICATLSPGVRRRRAGQTGGWSARSRRGPGRSQRSARGGPRTCGGSSPGRRTRCTHRRTGPPAEGSSAHPTADHDRRMGPAEHCGELSRRLAW